MHVQQRCGGHAPKRHFASDTTNSEKLASRLSFCGRMFNQNQMKNGTPHSTEKRMTVPGDTLSYERSRSI